MRGYTFLWNGNRLTFSEVVSRSALSQTAVWGRLKNQHQGADITAIMDRPRWSCKHCNKRWAVRAEYVYKRRLLSVRDIAIQANTATMTVYKLVKRNGVKRGESVTKIMGARIKRGESNA
jgi:hypothetical protein